MGIEHSLLSVVLVFGWEFCLESDGTRVAGIVLMFIAVDLRFSRETLGTQQATFSHQ